MSSHHTPSLRPRERMLALGPKALQTHELFSILLGTGTQHYPVEQLAKTLSALLARKSFSSITKDQLTKIKGIGKAKACTLLAVREIAERLYTESSIILNSPNAIASFLHEYKTSKKETLICLYLNARGTLEHKEILAVGSLNSAAVFPRDVFWPIKDHPVASIIFAHNHPSGNPEPSQNDRAFTARMKASADILGIEVMDHIILTANGVYSFKENGELELAQLPTANF